MLILTKTLLKPYVMIESVSVVNKGITQIIETMKD